MEHCGIYHNEIPDWLAVCADTPCMRRIRSVGMNCGCEYTSFPRFTDLAPYSRFDHSLGVALIVWHFTDDRKQAIAGLLHDVATPVFAHVVDFLHGDYLVQESTEDGSRALIASDAALCGILRRYGLTVDDVCDYHRYPIADNRSPRLSADRLEYTLGNLFNFHICTGDEVRAFYHDLTVVQNEDGEDELAFRSEKTAADFTAAALVCSGIYVSDEDRYAMQMLSELLHFAFSRGVLAEADLYSTEPAVIDALLHDPETAARWRTFCGFHAMRTDAPKDGGPWRIIPAKKRYIDPLIKGRGRVSACVPSLKTAIDAFLAEPQDRPIAAHTQQ